MLEYEQKLYFFFDYFHNFKIGGKKSDEKKKIQIHIFFPLNN